ncbi:hypothetical protein EYF80_034697 [Liparis tanakae]|uniref:Uncharacterized protein n=1 Tax=Liparis tanakae TaxID=230148 RepID=A0A4Z2GQR8_9TELE|nr:hypothetical protein EYF80_034697 [Liparis tanakae]
MEVVVEEVVVDECRSVLPKSPGYKRELRFVRFERMSNSIRFSFGRRATWVGDICSPPGRRHRGTYVEHGPRRTGARLAPSPVLSAQKTSNVFPLFPTVF